MDFDVIVVTAANEAQAAGYCAQLAWRKSNGLLPAETQALVVPDPGGRRVGSFAATLNVLVELAKTRRDPMAGRRVLICHSGGDSRRTPAYAAMGKAFAPLPCTTPDGRPLALFDLIVRHAADLPARTDGQLLVLSGDVLLTIKNELVDFSRPGLTGVAWMESMTQGSRHGVYVPARGAETTFGACLPVVDFLQKPSMAEATAAGALDSSGRVAVDTGILSFDAALCRRMLAFARKEARWLKTAPVLDVYEHFTGALVGKGPEKVRRAFAHTPFQVNMLPSCDFFHLGCSRELRAGLVEPSPTGAALGFRNGMCACAGRGPFAFDAILDGTISAAGDSLVEGVWRPKGSETVLAGRNVLTGVPAECTARIRLPKETGLVCLPVGVANWAAVAYRLDDNFKTDGKWDAKSWKVCRSVDAAVEHALQTLSAPESTCGARGLKSMSQIVPAVNHGRLLAARNAIFREVGRRRVAEDVARSYRLPDRPKRAAILMDQVVWAASPVRVDLAGGWSDTPPICHDMGGTVLNAAVTLNGQYPIQVMAKLAKEPHVRISSIDLGESRTFADSAELQDHSDPHEWCALPKAALVLAGIVPSRRGASLKAWLRGFGGGLDLTIFSALPKGSGMGTSSILGAAVLACLDRVQGIPFDADRIIRLTSVLEQRMNTGGGWQDQIGGLLPGVKLIETSAGLDQTPVCRPAPFAGPDGKSFEERCLLYFTGQRRMARNILRHVVDRWLSGEPAMRDIVMRLKEGARRGKAALDAHDLNGFAAAVRGYWELKKEIDPGSTNAGIEAILDRVRKETDALLLPGAGGGGFVFMVAKSAAAARRIRADLEANPPNRAGRFFDFALDAGGLKVTVL